MNTERQLTSEDEVEIGNCAVNAMTRLIFVAKYIFNEEVQKHPQFKNIPDDVLFDLYRIYLDLFSRVSNEMFRSNNTFQPKSADGGNSAIAGFARAIVEKIAEASLGDNGGVK